MKNIASDKPEGKFVAFFNDGSGADVFCALDNGDIIDTNGECVSSEYLISTYFEFMDLPDSFKMFWEHE